MQTQSGYFSRGSARLYYEVAGEGQPVVLLHAGVADSRQWNNEFPALARRYRVLRYDLRGYGKSDPVAGEFSRLADLLALLDHLHFDAPVVLIGCSMGGVLAMDFALEHGARAKALVMVGSYPSRLWLETPDHPKVAQAIAANEAGDLDLVAELEAQIWFDGMGRTPQQVDQAMRKLMLDMNRIALANEAKHLGRRLPDTAAPAAERLAELHIPVLVVTGDQDIPYIQAAADYMVEHIPTAQRAIIADAGHLLNMDHPDQFLRIILPFLDQVAAQP
jgi:pimeloyl-ACP methyl ester carboxylesterase